MRLRYLLPVALLLLPVGISDMPAAEDSTGSLSITLGQKTLDDDAKPAEVQNVFGARWTFGKKSWPIMFAVDVSTSTGDGSESGVFPYYVYYYGYYYGSGNLNVNVATTTVSFGVRKEWGKSTTRPFVGGGVEWIRADLKANFEFPGLGDPVRGFVDDDDTNIGYWAEAGVLWQVGKHLDIGFNVRYADAEASFKDVSGLSFDLKLSGIGYGVLLGTRW